MHTGYAYSVTMSIKFSLLALLHRSPMHGYQLRTSFEESTGGTWPLNIGQVYTTLTRLERDDLVRALPEGDGAQRRYEITGAGRAELADWFASPVAATDRPRDELAIKLALALTTPGVDIGQVIQTQRTATMGTIQSYTRLRTDAAPTSNGDLAWLLVLESMLFRAEAEMRWLDHCETTLVRFSPTDQPANPTRAGSRPAAGGHPIGVDPPTGGDTEPGAAATADRPAADRATAEETASRGRAVRR